MSADDPINAQPEGGETELIISREREIEYTQHRETDVRGAVVRGLAEYLRSLRAPWKGGEELRFLKVLDEYADGETLDNKFPAASVYTEEPGQYDASFSPRVVHQFEDGRVLWQPNDLEQNITVDIWTTTAAHRRGLLALLDDAFDPVENMTGFHLRLPHYFNVVAAYSVVSVQSVDASENAMKRWRLASITITASCPKLRLSGVTPGLDPRVVAQVVEP